MQSSKRRLRAALRKVCSQHLWMPVPPRLEDAIVDAAAVLIAPEDVDASPYGLLFELAVQMTHDYLGHGSFVTIYDDEVTITPRHNPELFADGEPGTYRAL